MVSDISCLQFLKKCAIQFFHHFRKLNGLDNALGEAPGEKLFRRLGRQAARLQVKPLILINLADGHTVRTFNIIGKNHQVGFIVRMAIIGKHEIVDQLVGAGRLRARVDDHGSIEAGTGMPVYDIFKMLMADTLG
ncbi:uncharacterized protein METZ01_LOCUS159741, partial [marine metagenome]